MIWNGGVDIIQEMCCSVFLFVIYEQRRIMNRNEGPSEHLPLSYAERRSIVIEHRTLYGSLCTSQTKSGYCPTIPCLAGTYHATTLVPRRFAHAQRAISGATVSRTVHW